MAAVCCVICSATPEQSDRFTHATPGCNHQYCGTCVDDLVKTKRFPPLICCEDNWALERQKLAKEARPSSDEQEPKAKKHKTKDKEKDSMDKAKATVYFHQLQDLRTASRNKVQAHTETARQMQAEGHVREVAYAVTKRIVTAPAEEKLGGWCLIDSIVRTVDTKVFAREFARHMPNLILKYIPVPPEARQQFLRIAERWRRDKLFPSEVLKVVKDATSSLLQS
jgi:hypothetical protein